MPLKFNFVYIYLHPAPFLLTHTLSLSLYFSSPRSFSVCLSTHCSVGISLVPICIHVYLPLMISISTSLHPPLPYTIMCTLFSCSQLSLAHCTLPPPKPPHLFPVPSSLAYTMRWLYISLCENSTEFTGQMSCIFKSLQDNYYTVN